MNLPNGWAMSTLGAECTKPQYGWTASAKKSGTVRLLRTTDLTNGLLNWETVPFSSEVPDDLEKYLVAKDDLFISRAGSVGVSVHLKSVDPEFPSVFASYLIRIRAGENLVPEYLAFFLQSPNYWSQVHSLSAGATMANINAPKIQSIKIPVPPINEQERIVEALDDHLSKLDRALAELHAGQELLKAATRSFLHKVLNGSGSAKKLSEVCSLITDGSHFSPKTVSQGYPYITVKDISGDEIDFDGCKYISGDAYAELEKNGCRPLPNDVLFSKDGTVGKVTVVSSDKPFVVLSSLAILRPDQQKVLPSFLKLSLKSPMVLETALGMKTGTAIRRVVLRNLKNLEIDVPPLEKQAQLVEYVESQLQAFNAIDKALQSQVAMIGGLRRSLLNASFTGQGLEGK